MTELKQRILRNQRLFDDVAALIPQKFYKMEEEVVVPKFMKNPKEIAPKQAIKEASKKAKKQRLDPEVYAPTVHEDEDMEEMDIPTVQPLENSDAVELKEKLQQRIQELRQKRGAADPKSRQELLEKRKQKQEKRKELLKKQKENRKMGLDTRVLFVHLGNEYRKAQSGAKIRRGILVWQNRVWERTKEEISGCL
jgi:phosphopantetheinyl transferase (holo-ACP synthase)